MAVYVCCKCLFCFERASNVDMCPDCANMNIRDATEEEIMEYRSNRGKPGGGNAREEKRVDS